MLTAGTQGSGKTAARSTAVAIAVAAALISGLLASPAAAFHVPGAYYSGFASGGGSINFSVSSDGSSVTNLRLNGPITMGGCTIDSASYSQPIPITNNVFDNGEVSGGFPDPRGAYGRFNVPGSIVLGTSPRPSCRVTGTWSALTKASPNGSAECKAALAAVRKAKRALRKAKNAGNQRKIKRARKRLGNAKAKRDQYCII